MTTILYPTQWLEIGTVVLVVKATTVLTLGIVAAMVLHRASAGSRHVLWLGMVVALLLLPALSSWGPLGLRILPAQTAPRVSEAASRERGAFDASIEGPAEGHGAAQGSPQRDLSVRSTPQWGAARVLLLGWGAVALALLAWLAWGFVAVRAVVRRATPLDAKDWLGPLYEIADRHALQNVPKLVASSEVAMPFAAGYRDPVVVLPASAESWSLERRRAVLMHELAHIRRRDIAGHTLGRVACALWWFHPLAWMAARRLRIESEKACDDLALSCGLTPSSYAEHLLDIVSSVRKSDTPSPAIAMAHRGEFEGRVLAILDPQLRRRDGRRGRVLLGAVLASMVALVGAATPARSTSAPQKRDEAVQAPPPDAAADTALPMHSSAPVTHERGTARIEPLRTGSVPTDQRSSGIPAPAPGSITSAPSDQLASLEQSNGRDRANILLRLLKSDTSANVRRIAAWGLQEFASRPEVGVALATALAGDDAREVREMAAWALGSGPAGPALAEPLANAVRHDRDPEVRESAAWALASVDARKAATALLSAIDDPYKPLRVTAIWAIGTDGRAPLPKRVIEALSDADASVRKMAAWAVYQSEDAAAVSALESALAKEDTPDVRRAFVRALGSIGEPSAAALARLLDDRDPQVREAVVSALAGAGSGPWPLPRPRPRPMGGQE